MRDVEETRKSYKPDNIKMLFVGESAPIGGKFFFFGNSTMHTFMARAFEKEFGPMGNFLTSFKAMGCYLDDVVLKPVNDLSAAERRRLCLANKDSLTSCIRQNQPQVVVCLMLGINEVVSEAAKNAGVEQFYCTHFPGQGHHREFAKEMGDILATHRQLLIEKA